MPDSPTDRNLTGSPHTRREFIKNVLVKTAYAAPIVATFVVAEDSEAGKNEKNRRKGKNRRRPRRGKHSNNSNRKISKVSGPSRPSSGSGIKYNKKHG